MEVFFRVSPSRRIWTHRRVGNQGEKNPDHGSPRSFDVSTSWSSLVTRKRRKIRRIRNFEGPFDAHLYRQANPVERTLGFSTKKNLEGENLLCITRSSEY
ncbi:unnamed protein product [Nesidiocoris tenuis]|uniref:Uncharacterized protein n=1 Tax=Nesidiocoris tenuis TaxID=355587 RepID=A0A6H5GW70_9HEMI|nr:unnamed protein product [Nesidiocoris tenuis]